MKRLVFVGAGHAHLTALMNRPRLPDDTHITVVNPSSHHYSSGMGPGMLSGMYRPRALRFHVQRLVEEHGAAFVVARVVQLHPAQNELVLENGDTLPYDIVSFATGSVVVLADLPHHAALFPVKPIEELLKARRAILARKEQTLRSAVFGGGAAGVEIAGNLWRLARECGKNLAITIVSASKILGRFPAMARLLARHSLERRGIAVLEDTHVRSIEKTPYPWTPGKPSISKLPSTRWASGPRRSSRAPTSRPATTAGSW